MKGVVPEDPYEAFRLVVKDADVGDVARVLGIPRGTLLNKASASLLSRAQPTLRDLIAVGQYSGDHRVAESLLRMSNRASFSLASGPVSDIALLELLARIGCEKGQMYQALLSGYADRRFCREDFAVVRAEAFDVITAVLNFIVRAEGLIDE
jgi:hypothetical protein